MLIIFLAAPGRCFVCNNNMLQEQEKSDQNGCAFLTNILFGIFTGVINSYHIRSYRIHETAKNRKVSQCPKSKTLRYKHFSYLKNENRQLSEKYIEMCAI